MAFHLTSAAAHEILAAARRSGAEGMALRVAAKPTPDGLAYGMGFDEIAPDDDVAMFDGLTVLIAAPSREWLAGTVLDYVELDGGGRDFIFVEQLGAESRFAAAPGAAGRSAGSECSEKSATDPNSSSQARGCGSCSHCG